MTAGSRKKAEDKSAGAACQTSAEARALAGGIPVFCAFDKLEDPKTLKGNPRNPNRHPKSQIKLLAGIIQSQGWRAPITVSAQSGLVVRGHGRLAAAISFGAESVPVDFQNYASEAEEWADLVADNRLAELAETDNAALADILAEMDTGEIPITLSGYTEEDIEGILAAIAGVGDAEADGADEIPDAPEAPMTKPGDIWLLGGHRLLCGDATDGEDVDRLMGGELASMVFTDPPYGVAYTGSSKKRWDMIEADGNTHDDLLRFLVTAFRNLVAHTEPDAAFYIWHAWGSRREFDNAMTAAGLVEKQQIVWVKNHFQLGRSDYHWAHEPCIYAGKDGQSAKFHGDRRGQTVWRATLRKAAGMEAPIADGIMLTDGAGGKMFVCRMPPKGKKTRYIRLAQGSSALLHGESKASTAWEVSRETGIEHPTQKPVELAERAIGNSSLPGEIVLDLFGGSGTTLVGAEKTGRMAYLMEIDPRYADVSVKRYLRIAGNTARIQLERGGKTYGRKELSGLDGWTGLCQG